MTDNNENDNDAPTTNNDAEVEMSEEEFAEMVGEAEKNPEDEIEEMEDQLNQFHDMLDQVKEGGRGMAQAMQQEAQEAQQAGDEEIAQEYLRLANAANTVFRRVEEGDKTVRRGGI